MPSLYGQGGALIIGTISLTQPINELASFEPLSSYGFLFFSQALCGLGGLRLAWAFVLIWSGRGAPWGALAQLALAGAVLSFRRWLGCLLPWSCCCCSPNWDHVAVRAPSVMPINPALLVQGCFGNPLSSESRLWIRPVRQELK